jgi:ankyrin repeat protein
MHYMTFTNRHVFTCLIPYDSKAEKIMVPRDGDLTTVRAKAVEERIRTMRADGGTNFTAAFKMIQEVLLGTKDQKGNWSQGAPVTVSSAVVVFMTDGQDNTYYGKANGAETLVSTFKTFMKDWTKPLTVHTIGFSESHDFGFLDKLRQVGSDEGVFRYADPRDDGDTLCQKMSDLATSIISNTALQATIYTPFPLRGSAKHSEPVPANSRYKDDPLKKYKTELSFDMDDGHGRLNLFLDAKASEVKEKLDSFIVEIGRRDFEFKVDYEMEGGDEKDLLQKWMNYLSKDILHRTVLLANTSDRTSTSFLLKCSLLLKQARSIALHIRSDASLSDQMKMCIEQLENLLRGKAASVARLSDVAQSQNIKVAAPTTTTSSPSPSSLAKPSPSHNQGPARLNDLRTSIRTCRGKRNKLHLAVLNGSKQDVALLATEEPQFCIEVDDQGNTPLMYACCTGRVNVIGVLFGASVEAQKQSNKLGHTPLDMACLCGRWKSVEVLLSAGACLGQDADSLLRTLLQYRYYNTAGRLIAQGLVTISLDVLRGDLPAATLEWIMEKMAERDVHGTPGPASPPGSAATPAATPASSATTTTAAAVVDTQSEKEKATLYLKNAVQNGMVNLVRKLLVNEADITLDLLFLCGPKGDEGADIAELLLEKGLHPDTDDGSLHLPPDQPFETPLFRAAEKGWDQLLIVLLNHGANANFQNASGNTPLWIACMNRHLECITELLNAGADPNLPNHRGDLPLMCAAQRNMCSGVASLLAVNAKIDCTDPKVNNPVLVCCRMGHDVILNTLLAKLVREDRGEDRVRDQLNVFATIDGFNPLLAAAEQNRSECIKVLASFKADLECKTSDDNKILACATPLHIAVYYGCVEAAMTLLELGVDPNSRDLLGRTPLHIAVLQSNCMMVRLLKTYKADFAIQDEKGHVASFYASSTDVKFEMDDPSLKYLLQLAQSGSLDPALRAILLREAHMPGVLKPSECVDVASGDGWTPLMEAVVYGNSEFAKVLVELGVDPHRKDVHGLSAAFWATLLGRNHTEVFGKEIVLSENEASAATAIDNFKRLDVRNAVLFDIDLAALQKETNSETVTNKSDEKTSFLRFAMENHSEKWDSAEAVEIPKTRSKCSVASFLKTSAQEKAMWPRGAKAICPNYLLLGSLASAAKYLAKRGTQEGEELGLQELTALNLISSNFTFFACMNVGLASANKTWLPFVTLSLRALELLPSYDGEVYRGISTKFTASAFEIGKKITWPHFSMCTSSWYELLDKDQSDNSFKYNVMFLIQPSKGAKSLTPFSNCATSCPVAFAPNATFVIKDLHIADVIALGQPNIRHTAYKMNDSYLSQAEKKQRPVFVVLEVQ